MHTDHTSPTENKTSWHGHIPSEEDLNRMKKALEADKTFPELGRLKGMIPNSEAFSFFDEILKKN